MPVDIYAALTALVRAEATRDHERRATASASPSPGDAPDGARTADAGPQPPREDSGTNDN